MLGWCGSYIDMGESLKPGGYNPDIRLLDSAESKESGDRHSPSWIWETLDTKHKQLLLKTAFIRINEPATDRVDFAELSWEQIGDHKVGEQQVDLRDTLATLIEEVSKDVYDG